MSTAMKQQHHSSSVSFDTKSTSEKKKRKISNSSSSSGNPAGTTPAAGSSSNGGASATSSSAAGMSGDLSPAASTQSSGTLGGTVGSGKDSEHTNIPIKQHRSQGGCDDDDVVVDENERGSSADKTKPASLSSSAMNSSTSANKPFGGEFGADHSDTYSSHETSPDTTAAKQQRNRAAYALQQRQSKTPSSVGGGGHTDRLSVVQQALFNLAKCSPAIQSSCSEDSGDEDGSVEKDGAHDDQTTNVASLALAAVRALSSLVESSSGTNSREDASFETEFARLVDAENDPLGDASRGLATLCRQLRKQENISSGIKISTSIVKKITNILIGRVRDANEELKKKKNATGGKQHHQRNSSQSSSSGGGADAKLDAHLGALLGIFHNSQHHLHLLHSSTQHHHHHHKKVSATPPRLSGFTSLSLKAGITNMTVECLDTLLMHPHGVALLSTMIEHAASMAHTSSSSPSPALQSPQPSAIISDSGSTTSAATSSGGLGGSTGSGSSSADFSAEIRVIQDIIERVNRDPDTFFRSPLKHQVLQTIISTNNAPHVVSSSSGHDTFSGIVSHSIENVEAYATHENASEVLIALVRDISLGLKIRKAIVNQLPALSVHPVAKNVVLAVLEHTGKITKSMGQVLLDDVAAEREEKAVAEIVALACHPIGEEVVECILDLCAGTMKVCINTTLREGLRAAKIKASPTPDQSPALTRIAAWSEKQPTFEEAIVVKETKKSDTEIVVPCDKVQPTAALSIWQRRSSVSDKITQSANIANRRLRQAVVVCPNYLKGACKAGEGCTLAHIDAAGLERVKPKDCCAFHGHEESIVLQRTVALEFKRALAAANGEEDMMENYRTTSSGSMLSDENMMGEATATNDDLVNDELEQFIAALTIPIVVDEPNPQSPSASLAIRHVPFVRFAITLGLRTYMLQDLVNDIPLESTNLCRQHRRGACFRPDQCKYVHLCRDECEILCSQDGNTAAAASTSVPPLAPVTAGVASSTSSALARKGSSSALNNQVPSECSATAAAVAAMSTAATIASCSKLGNSGESMVGSSTKKRSEHTKNLSIDTALTAMKKSTENAVVSSTGGVNAATDSPSKQHQRAHSDPLALSPAPAAAAIPTTGKRVTRMPKPAAVPRTRETSTATKEVSNSPNTETSTTPPLAAMGATIHPHHQSQYSTGSYLEQSYGGDGYGAMDGNSLSDLRQSSYYSTDMPYSPATPATTGASYLGDSATHYPPAAAVPRGHGASHSYTSQRELASGMGGAGPVESAGPNVVKAYRDMSNHTPATRSVASSGRLTPVVREKVGGGGNSQAVHMDDNVAHDQHYAAEHHHHYTYSNQEESPHATSGSLSYSFTPHRHGAAAAAVRQQLELSGEKHRGGPPAPGTGHTRHLSGSTVGSHSVNSSVNAFATHVDHHTLGSGSNQSFQHTLPQAGQMPHQPLAGRTRRTPHRELNTPTSSVASSNFTAGGGNHHWNPLTSGIPSVMIPPAPQPPDPQEFAAKLAAKKAAAASRRHSRGTTASVGSSSVGSFSPPHVRPATENVGPGRPPLKPSVKRSHQRTSAVCVEDEESQSGADQHQPDGEEASSNAPSSASKGGFQTHVASKITAASGAFNDSQTETPRQQSAGMTDAGPRGSNKGSKMANATAAPPVHAPPHLAGAPPPPPPPPQYSSTAGVLPPPPPPPQQQQQQAPSKPSKKKQQSATSTPVTATATATPSPSPSPSPSECKYWKLGCCDRLTDCKFHHDPQYMQVNLARLQSKMNEATAAAAAASANK